MRIFNRTSGFILLTALLWACDSKPNQEATEESTEEFSPNQRQAICLGNNVSVRKKPATTGDLLTAIAIGESVAWLDSVVVDTKSKGKYEYALIRLSDGTEGWAVKSYLFEDTQLIAITAHATIYTRPDLLTATKKSFKPLDLLVITSVENEAKEGNWLPVTGKIQGTKSFTSGWIIGGNATPNQSDVLVAQLVYKANELKDEKRMEELNSITSDEAYSNSIFLNQIRTLTYHDPNGFLKEELEKYYVGLINYYDSAGHDHFYQYQDSGPSVDIFGKTFHSYKISEWRENNHWFIWDLFYGFSTYAASEKGYESAGYYGTYFEERDRQEAMSKVAGMPVYSRAMAEYDNQDFNRVNPNFVRWASSNLIPHPDNDFLGMASQHVYEVVFRENARDTWKQWRLMNYQFNMDEVAVSYADGMEYEDFSGFNFLTAQFRETNVNPVLAGVFIRRRIDGSYNEVIHAMQKVLALYDSDWINEQQHVAPNTYFSNEFSEEEYYEEDYYYEEEAVEEVAEGEE